MSDFKQVFSEEIRRLSRKELKAVLAPLAKSLAHQRQVIAELKKQVKLLESAVTSSGVRVVPEKAEASEVQAVSRRMNGKRIAAWRKKLNLSQAQFAVLAGVSLPSVVNWEGNKSIPRAAQKEKLAEIRSLGKREIAKRLAAAGIVVKSVRKSSKKNAAKVKVAKAKVAKAKVAAAKKEKNK